MTEYGNRPAPPKPSGGVPSGGGVQVATKPSTNPCEPLRLAWVKAQAMCNEANERAKKAKEEKTRDEAELADLELQFPELGGGNEGADVDGEDFTFNDLRMLESLAASAFKRYTANPTPENAQAAQKAAQQRLTPEMRDRLRREKAEMDARKQQLQAQIAASQAVIDEAKRLCDEATAAKKAWDDCVGAPSAKPGSAADEGSTGTKADDPGKPNDPQKPQESGGGEKKEPGKGEGEKKAPGTGDDPPRHPRG